jgi:signal transduction histidine kinase
MVVTADAERRALERALHDGAQQRIAALNTTLVLAERRLNGTCPGNAVELLTQASEEAKRCLEDLRDLARLIYPAVLAERGLASALTDLAHRSPGFVEVVETPEARFAEPVELAAYLVASEALSSLGESGDATLGAEVVDGELRLWLRGASLSGEQLERLRDRVEALGGRLESAGGGEPHVLAALPAA